MLSFTLLEVDPPFMRGGARHYCNGVRISAHDFCTAIHLSTRKDGVLSKSGINRNGDTCRRHWVTIYFDRLPTELNFPPFAPKRACRASCL